MPFIGGAGHVSLGPVGREGRIDFTKMIVYNMIYTFRVIVKPRVIHLFSYNLFI